MDKQNPNSATLIDAINDLAYSKNTKLLFENRTENEWLNTIQAANFLGISPNALRIMVHREQIPTYKFGKRLRFRMKDCVALFQRKGA